MTVDLSAVTDTLINLVKDRWTAAPLWAELGGGPTFTPHFTGLAPDAARQQPGPQLSLFLYHIEVNNAAASLFWQPQILDGTSQPVRFLPVALDAFYLLFAYSEASFIEEQEAMSIAIRAFHTQPIVRSPAGATVPWELTLTPEHCSYDELSRLWHATTVPMRMSLVYRAAVVFLDPDPMPGSAPETTSVTIAVGLEDAAEVAAGDPSLMTTRRQVAYAAPGGEAVTYAETPATVAPGQVVSLLGTALGGPTSDTVYLLDPTGTELDVSGWLDAAASNASRMVLQLPTAVGAVPAAAPEPGRYQIRVGHGTEGAVGSYRSNALPLAVAPLLDATGGPVLSGATPYSVGGAGLASTTTVVTVGSQLLAPVAGSPSTGQVSIAPAGTSLSFVPPAGPAGTVLELAVQVAGVRADPALWVQL